MRLVPGGAQVFEVADGRVQRRDARHLGRRIVRQDVGAPVDAGVAKPALGAGHEADRRRGAAAARQFADDRAAVGRPGQRELVRRQLVGMRHVQERGQQRLRFDRAGRCQLRHRQHAVRGGLAVAGVDVDEGQRAVRGAEVDADRIAWRRFGDLLACGVHSSTSAGASTRGSCPAASCGRRTSATRQPRWRRRAAERRLADDVAGQAHGRRIEACRQHDAAALGLVAHRHDAEVLAQDLGAAFVHQACGSADLARRCSRRGSR